MVVNHALNALEQAPTSRASAVNLDGHYSIVPLVCSQTHEATGYAAGMAGESHNIHAHFTFKHDHLLYPGIQPYTLPEL